MKLKIIPSIFYALLIISCSSKTNEKQSFTRENKTKDSLTKIQNPAIVKNDTLVVTSKNKNSIVDQTKTTQNRCEIHWRRLDSLNKIKREIFRCGY